MSESNAPTAAEVHALLERVIDLEPEARAAVLDAECVERPALRARVEALLAVDATAHALLDDGAVVLRDLLLDEHDSAPAVIGRYRIVRELGRGGMGVVYLAERDDPELRQRVALKVIGTRSDAAELARRFRRERQILADLRHPNIAQLIDGGLTPDGVPFLVMEYVEGERIDDWCDARGLDVEERVRLFLSVCDAAQHAHERRIIHRDLKPANIMVTADGLVKLVDFGIAKIVRDTAGGDDLTQTALHAFTPRYGSPEQIRGHAPTPATDVYALGVILFELLAGASPFPPTNDAFEAARAVLERDPRPPSQAVPGEEPGRAIAATRSTSTDRLRRRLRGDLDAIVLRALRRESRDRYPDAGALRDDLERFLEMRPVQARPYSAAYRLRKFVSRRREAVAALVAFMLMIASFALIYATRAIANTGAATQSLAAYDHLLRGDYHLTARTADAVRRALAEYEAAALADAEDATPLFRQAYAYLIYADWDWPHPQLERAQLIDRAAGLLNEGLQREPESAEGWVTRAYLHVVADPRAMSGAVEAFEHALVLDDGNAEAWHQYGQTLMVLGRWEEAAAAYRRVLEIEPRRSMTLVPLAAIALYRNELTEALVWADSAVGVDPANSYARANRARLYLQMGDTARARREAELAAGVDQGHETPVLATLATALAHSGAHDQARVVFERAVQNAGEDALAIVDAPQLAMAAAALGEIERAVALLQRAEPKGAWFWFYLQTPLLSELRDEPRVRALIDAVDPRGPAEPSPPAD